MFARMRLKANIKVNIDAMRRAIAFGLCLILIFVAGCGNPIAQTVPTAPTPAPTPVPTATPKATEISTLTPEPTPTGAPQTAPLPTDAPTQSPSSANDFTPAQRSVWNTTIGPDKMTGTCAQGSVLPAYGLVQITPKTATGSAELEWKNQEPKPYAMKRIDVNQYAYAGPNAINDGMVTMTVKFLDDKNLTMLRQYTSKADPGCTHTHEYTGEFKWFR